MADKESFIFSHLATMEEEKTDMTPKKKKEGNRKRANLILGLICGLALFVVIALLVFTEMKINAGTGTSNNVHSTWMEYRSCLDAGCPEEECAKLKDSICFTPECQDAVETCMGRDGRHPRHLTHQNQRTNSKPSTATADEFNINDRNSSKTRRLQKIKVKACNLPNAGSSTNKMKLKICKTGDMSCCITDMFGINIKRGLWSTKDIEGKLGQCDGFPIEGTDVEISIKNKGLDAVCLDEFQIFGAEDHRSYAQEIPFLHCNPSCQIWGKNKLVHNGFWGFGRVGSFKNNPQSYCEGDSDWNDWDNVKAKCIFDTPRETEYR